MIPRWLQTHLENTGRWNHDGISRHIAHSACPTCRTHTLTGLDDEPLGWPTRVDPTPLNNHGELAALLAGRHTYTLRRTGPKLTLDRRDRWTIADTPADQETRGDILATHQCGHHWPAELTAASTLAQPATADLPLAPPF